MTDQTPALQRPATRAARLSAIEQALLTRIVTSQSQLSQILADQGIEVTQATLSRDLDVWLTEPWPMRWADSRRKARRPILMQKRNSR